MQYANIYKVLAPRELTDSIKKRINEVADKYII